MMAKRIVRVLPAFLYRQKVDTTFVFFLINREYFVKCASKLFFLNAELGTHTNATFSLIGFRMRDLQRWELECTERNISLSI